MSWLIFAMTLLFVSAVDSYLTRRREARVKAHTGIHNRGAGADSAVPLPPAVPAPAPLGRSDPA